VLDHSQQMCSDEQSLLQQRAAKQIPPFLVEGEQEVQSCEIVLY